MTTYSSEGVQDLVEYVSATEQRQNGTAAERLDHIIGRNIYDTSYAGSSNLRYRPQVVG